MAIEEIPQPPIQLNMLSQVNLRGEPFIKLTWGVMEGKLSAEHARHLGMMFFECAEAAVSDAAVFKFFTAHMGIEPPIAARILGDLRDFRVDQQEEEA